MTLTALSKRCKHLEPRSSSRREKAKLGSLHLVTVIVPPRSVQTPHHGLAAQPQEGGAFRTGFVEVESGALHGAGTFPDCGVVIGADQIEAFFDTFPRLAADQRLAFQQ